MTHKPRTRRPNNHSVTPIGPRGTGTQAPAPHATPDVFRDPIVLRAAILGLDAEVLALQHKRSILVAHLTAQGKTAAQIVAGMALPAELHKTAQAPKPKRHMSEAGREAIRAATKARWARLRKQQAANGQKRKAAA